MVFSMTQKKTINPAIVSETMSDMFMEEDEDEVLDFKPTVAAQLVRYTKHSASMNILQTG